MAVEGSDCTTGKWQFATREAAEASATAARVMRGWRMSAYRCPFCDCWHVGNRRAQSSKSRRR